MEKSILATTNLVQIAAKSWINAKIAWHRAKSAQKTEKQKYWNVILVMMLKPKIIGTFREKMNQNTNRYRFPVFFVWLYGQFRSIVLEKWMEFSQLFKSTVAF
jgi:hypothetical protein